MTNPYDLEPGEWVDRDGNVRDRRGVIVYRRPSLPPGYEEASGCLDIFSGDPLSIMARILDWLNTLIEILWSFKGFPREVIIYLVVIGLPLAVYYLHPENFEKVSCENVGYDGIYQQYPLYDGLLGSFRHYLRFYQDGTVVALKEPLPADMVFEIFKYLDKDNL